jgi:hypothetical protein
MKFDHVIFQFPYSGNRKSVENNHTNFILVHDFLKSALSRLKSTGSAVISAVDNDYYNNIFQFDKIATILDLKKPIKYLFDPKDFLEYTHTMTNEDGSALENHKKFATWEFKL